MDDSSSHSQDGSGNNRRLHFHLSRRDRQNPPPDPSPQASSSSAANILTPVRIALGITPPSRHPPAPAPPGNSATSEPINSSPIHTRPMAVNPQSASQFYNGAMPAEIRDLIFQYALTEYTKTDDASQYPASTNYTRPGYTGKRAVTIALLLTCRRVYLETYHLPAQAKEHVFWHARWPPHHERYANQKAEQEQVYFSRLTTWQLALVKEVHLFTQLYWLEDGSFRSLTQEGFMQGVERLRITIRRGDWWWNERNAPLGISPQRGRGEWREMRADWEAEERGEAVPWRGDGWGCAFGNLRGLRELEIEFETSEDKVGELAKIVQKAKTWRFPMGDGRVLSAEGLEAKEWKWRSPLCYWSEHCPYCFGSVNSCQGIRTQNPQCLEKRRLRRQGLGPECTVFSVRWRVSSAAS